MGRHENTHAMHLPTLAELEKLVNMSGTLFIYAATVCKYISQRGSLTEAYCLSDVVNFILEPTFNITQPLDILYGRILDAVYNLTNPRERLDIGMVLKTVVYVFNPVSMIAINGLMEMSIG